MFKHREKEVDRRGQSLLSSVAEPRTGRPAESRLSLALAKARAERAALERRGKQVQGTYEPAPRKAPKQVRDQALREAELDDVAAIARHEAAIVARRIAEEAAYAHQMTIEEIRVSLREIRDAIHDLAHVRARRRYF